MKEEENVLTQLSCAAMTIPSDSANGCKSLAINCWRCSARSIDKVDATCNCNIVSEHSTASSNVPVIELDVSSTGLCTLSDSLVQLAKESGATKLDLAYNSLVEVPASVFDNLSMVCVLTLAGNDLQELPMAISQLRNLCEINISNNHIRSLPSSIVQLSQLKKLNFACNLIECLPYEFGRLTSLETILGYENQLKTLPDTFGLLKRLSVLELGENVISSLPRNFGYLRSLQTLNMSGNKLGLLPESFSSLESVVFLDLSGNGLNSLPPRFRSSQKLQRLFVEKNRLASLPEWFSDMPELIELGLKDNHLAESPFPDEFGSMCKRLKVLELGGNFIKYLPESLGELKFLERFHIGSVIDELERANFQNGNWIWKLPTNFGLLASLSYANLNENQLSELPGNFGDLVNLEWLDLGQNRLYELPESFGNLRSLKYCQLSKNHLELLPSNFGNLTQLLELRLDGNRIAELPLSFCQLTKLKTLDLFSNRLTEIPSFLSTFTQLTRYDLGENKFGIHRLLVPQMIRPNKYAERDQALKNNWRGRKRVDHVEMDVVKVIEPDASYDLSKEEPEEEQLNSSLLARVAQRNMSIWRSHGMSEERPVYSQPEDETVDDSSDSSDTDAHEECYINNNDDETDDWFTEDKLSLSSQGSQSQRLPSVTESQSVSQSNYLEEEDWDKETIEVTTSSPYEPDDAMPMTGTGKQTAHPVVYHSPFYFLPASWHAQSIVKKKTLLASTNASLSVDPCQFDDV